MTAKDFVNIWGISAHSELTDRNRNNPDWGEANHYNVTLKIRDGGKVRQFTTPFSKGLGHTTRPNAAEVVECLSMDIVGLQDSINFEDWCANYGYSEDSRHAETIYRIIDKQSERMASFLNQSTAWQQFLSLEEE